MNIPVVHRTEPNPQTSNENRQAFESLGVVCLNVVGGAGCGKTSVLEAVLPRMRNEMRIGVLKGDLATTRDAQRLGALGFPAVQVLTDGRCHLDGAQVQKGMAELPLDELDMLVIENVGDATRAPTVELGENLRVAVVSVAEGQAVVLKHPELIRCADLILITKYDLLPHAKYDLDGTVRLLRRVNPTAEIICTDTRNRVGIDRTAGWLLGYVRAQRGHRMLQADPALQPS